MLESQQISQSWTVSDVVQKCPGTSRVFIEKKMLCLGCCMARFCTISEVARVYRIDTETLVHEIQQVAINKYFHAKTFQGFQEEDSN